jgi:hypothetical protein
VIHTGQGALTQLGIDLQMLLEFIFLKELIRILCFRFSYGISFRIRKSVVLQKCGRTLSSISTDILK